MIKFGATPESKGISSSSILSYLKIIEEAELSTHSLIIARGNDVIFECYPKPFDRDTPHRQYSASKSIVAIAVGFAEQDGLLSLDDPMEKHFPKELADQTDENLRRQTVREMLMMTTSRLQYDWFGVRTDDRVRHYFKTTHPVTRPAGTIFYYDSASSFVLGALVERLTGKTLTDYLRVKLFDKIGVSKDVRCLKCPGGHSWGDSGFIVKSVDMLLIAKFLMDGGRSGGEQLLNKEFVRAAISKQVDNNPLGINSFDTQGYGYYIWRTFDNSYFFNGMGCQFAVCVPDKDITFVYNGDNQAITAAKAIVMDNFFSLIARPAQSSALPENPAAHSELIKYSSALELAHTKGEPHSAFEAAINGRVYTLAPNSMGIKRFCVSLDENGGKFDYVNEQGEKTLVFGLGENRFGIFPQSGYSSEIGSVASDVHYPCAVSAAWVEPQKLHIKVQTLGDYLGRLNIILGFKDNRVGVFMQKSAEDFLDEYEGFADGTAEIQAGKR